MKRTLVAIVLMAIVFALAAYAPPHPKYNGKVKLPRSHSSEIFGKTNQQRNPNVPDSVLVLMVQFSDVHLVTTPQYPDSLVHNRAFFERYMLHLTDYYTDASHGLYELQYSVYDPVITLPHTMAYYGVDSDVDSILAVVRTAEFARDIINLIDDPIDFNQYDAIVVFHAGAGQESDISRIRKNELWSTFISRIDLQLGFDPTNDNYPGIATNDGKYVKEMVVAPEWEWQDYFPQTNSGYIFNTLGVLANQFGHQLGMPNLYDNDWSNGSSEGVGSFCVMGTGAWNANGYVPALPSAYCRIRMGWEQPEVISQDTQQIQLDYLLSHNFDTQKVVKFPISNKEYFLIENREQNPDNSYLNSEPSFTFTLLDEGQIYIPADSLHPDAIPVFDFMHNRYKGCEWDFFLPGYGGPPTSSGTYLDGSGLLIWHVDENVIDANFNQNIGLDQVNSIASHKGVDLEEADGVQDLDATNVSNPNFRGGPNDSYRAGNNTYFGQTTHNGFTSEPSADSYYGGIPLEVSNISSAGLNMTFDVAFRWSVHTDYVGTNTIPASLIDFDNDGKDELFYPMPDGSLGMWKEKIPFPLTSPEGQISKMYIWDSSDSKLFIPYDKDNNQTAALYNFVYNSDTNDTYSEIFNRTNRTWAASPISMNQNTVVLPLNVIDADSSEIVFQSTGIPPDKITVSLPGHIGTNILFADQQVISVTQKDQHWFLNRTDYASHETSEFQLPFGVDSLVTSIALVPLSQTLQSLDGAKDTSSYDLVICAGQGLYAFNHNNELKKGYPAIIPFKYYALPSFSDIDQNGYLETLIGGENSIAIFSYDGSIFNHPLTTVTNPDTLNLAGGIWGTSLFNDGKMQIFGNMSKNRLYAWDVEKYPAINPSLGFPISMGERSISYPLIGADAGHYTYIYSASNSGVVYRQTIDSLTTVDISAIRQGWYTEYANLSRNAVYVNNGLTNQYKTSKLFVPGEVYIYPNPWKQMYAPEITFRIMTSKQAKVDVKIYDITGQQLYANKITCEAYLPNQQKIQLPLKKMSSGIYIAEIYSNGERKSLKFAIEK